MPPQQKQVLPTGAGTTSVARAQATRTPLQMPGYAPSRQEQPVCDRAGAQPPPSSCADGTSSPAHGKGSGVDSSVGGQVRPVLSQLHSYDFENRMPVVVKLTRKRSAT